MGVLSGGSSARVRRSWTALGLVVVLLVSGGLVAYTAVAPSRPAADCSRLEQGTAAEASALAVACGADVEVVSERSPWVSVFARPDGLSRATVSTVPSHTMNRPGMSGDRFAGVSPLVRGVR